MGNSMGRRRLLAAMLACSLASELVPAPGMSWALAAEDDVTADQGIELVSEDEPTWDAEATGKEQLGAVTDADQAEVATESLPAPVGEQPGAATETPINLADEGVAISVTLRGGNVRTYTGDAIVPDVERLAVSVDGDGERELVYGRDYVLGADPCFTNNVDVTDEGAALTIVGRGAYAGVRVIPGVFTITPLDLGTLGAESVSLPADTFEYATVPADLDVRLALGEVELSSGADGALAVTKLTDDEDAAADDSYDVVIAPADGNENLTGELVVRDAYSVETRSFGLDDLSCLPTEDTAYSSDGTELRHAFDGLCVRFDDDESPALSVADGGLSLAFYAITDSGQLVRLPACPCVEGSYVLLVTSGNESYVTEQEVGVELFFNIRVTDPTTVSVPMASETHLTYNGREQHAELLPGAVWGFGWHVVSDDTFVSDVTAADAGTYSFTAALTSPTTTRWADGTTESKVVSWTIDPLDITGKRIELCDDAEGSPLAYAGGSPVEASYVKVGDDLIAADNFDIVYPDDPGATEGRSGSARAFIQGKSARGNVIGAALVDYDIAKVSLDGSTLTLGDVVIDANGVASRAATLALPDGSLVDPQEYTVLYTRAGDEGQPATATLPTAAGTYAVTVIPNAMGNYADGTLAVVGGAGIDGGLLTIA